jgi:hypothetical protein
VLLLTRILVILLFSPEDYHATSDQILTRLLEWWWRDQRSGKINYPIPFFSIWAALFRSFTEFLLFGRDLLSGS